MPSEAAMRAAEQIEAVYIATGNRLPSNRGMGRVIDGAMNDVLSIADKLAEALIAVRDSRNKHIIDPALAEYNKLGVRNA